MFVHVGIVVWVLLVLLLWWCRCRGRLVVVVVGGSGMWYSWNHVEGFAVMIMLGMERSVW